MKNSCVASGLSQTLISLLCSIVWHCTVILYLKDWLRTQVANGNGPPYRSGSIKQGPGCEREGAQVTLEWLNAMAIQQTAPMRQPVVGHGAFAQLR
jgi:hypothetical protein